MLDANPAPGGAWQHRWPTLRMAHHYRRRITHGGAQISAWAPPNDSTLLGVSYGNVRLNGRMRGVI